MLTKFIRKDVITAMAVLLLLLGALNYQTAFAADGIGVSNQLETFSFTIQDYYGNGQEGDARYRDTYGNDDQWKIKMTSSNEPPISTNTISKFWLKTPMGANVSPSVLVLEGTSSYYYKTAEDDADHTWVLLTGENNNFNGNEYTVKGYWAEETGIAP